MSNETPVSLLNQICTQNELNPVYSLIAKEGRVHAPVFTYRVELSGLTEEGSGQSKKKAKHIAARQLLKAMLKVEICQLEEEQSAAIGRCLKRCEEEEAAEGTSKQTTGTATTTAKQQGAILAPDSDAKELVNNNNAGHEKGSKALTAGQPDSAASDEVNPIGKLQEICMKKHWHPPVYEDIGEKGLPHEREFHVYCEIENINLRETGIGKSKKIAKRQAALEMLKRLRRENLDKTDELMDRLPRNAWSGAGFDLVKEMLTMNTASQNHKTTGTAPLTERTLRATFWEDLKSDPAKMSTLAALFGGNLSDYIIRYIGSKTVIPEVETLVERLEKLLNVRLEMCTYDERRFDNRFQSLGELIAREPKYGSVSVLASYGTDEQLTMLQKKTMSRVVVVLLMSLVD